MSDDVVFQSPKMYRVLREGGQWVLEVVVGGIAMYAVRVRMTADEVAAFHRDGHADGLAKAVMADPKLGGRAYNAP